MSALTRSLGLMRSLAIYYGQPWKRSALRAFYAGLLTPGDIVFDIGAHVGSRTRLFHGLGCKVIALEPQPLFHRFLARTLPEGVVLRAEAVASTPGHLRLNISSRHPTVSTLSADWIDQVQAADGFQQVVWDESVEVPVTTLDKLIDTYGIPAFVKIDVEGMEADILDGLSHPVQSVATEYIPATLDIANRCIDRLATLGDYEFNRVEGERARFADPDWLTGEAMKQRLRDIATKGQSGDLYARLRQST